MMRTLVSGLLFMVVAEAVWETKIKFERKEGSTGANATATCSFLAAQLEARGVWRALRNALESVKSPAVMIFSNSAHYKLLHNFLCGLIAKGLRQVFAHILVWSADDSAYRALLNDWPEIATISLATIFEDSDNAELDAPFKEAGYAKFAALKALMPWSANRLGYSTLVQDADIVWNQDVLALLSSEKYNEYDGIFMPDSNRVNVALRPCRRKEASLIRAYIGGKEASDPLQKQRLPFTQAECAAYRCITSVNGGFIFSRHSSRVHTALKHWFTQCPSIIHNRENQPALVRSLQEAIAPGHCTYLGINTTRHQLLPHRKKRQLAVLDIHAFTSGQRIAVALEARDRGDLVAFHCNFRFGWRAKCQTLQKMDMLYLQAISPGKNVCDEPPSPQCRDGSCTAGVCMPLTGHS